MADVFTKKKRSEVMSRIRGSGNKDTELRLIQVFREFKITGWRRRWPLFGKPDFVFPNQRLAVFVDGCFWHRCPKPGHSKLPGSNVEFWAAKLARNVARDRLVSRTLRKAGWLVARIWECDLPMGSRTASRISRLLASAKAGKKPLRVARRGN